jgi:hypothetical protein
MTLPTQLQRILINSTLLTLVVAIVMVPFAYRRWRDGGNS